MADIPQKRSQDLEEEENTCSKSAKIEAKTIESIKDSPSLLPTIDLKVPAEDLASDIGIEEDLNQDKNTTCKEFSIQIVENGLSENKVTSHMTSEEKNMSHKKEKCSTDSQTDNLDKSLVEKNHEETTEVFEEVDNTEEMYSAKKEEPFEEINTTEEKMDVVEKNVVVESKSVETVEYEKDDTADESTTTSVENSTEDDQSIRSSDSEKDELYLEPYKTYEEHLEDGFVVENEDENRLLLIGYTPTQIELLRPLSRAKKELLESQESLDESLSAAVREIQPDLVAAQEAIGASDNTEENQTVVKDSNVYIPLNTDIDRMAKEQHSLEIKKALNYPRFYKYHDQLKIQVTESEEKAILTFKQILVKTGQIGQYDPEAFSVPKKFDLLKNYFVSGSNDDLYYKSKMTPDLSSDKLVQDLIGKTKIDIVISTNCLIKLAEMQSDFTVGGCIPLIVEQDGSRKVLYFERPLPKERLSAMDKNKIVYDAAFKSICLDWANRHPVSSNPIKCEHNNDWNYHDDENLQYTHWVFGGLSLLIQYQFDSEITNTEKRANLISKLEYKTDDKQEVTTASERVTNWLRSYIGGHSIVIEGKVDVANNSLTSIKKKQMVDIMGDWVPNYESEMLRQTIFSLHRKLKAGNYLLDHKPNDKCFVIYASTDDGTFDLHKKYSEL